MSIQYREAKPSEQHHPIHMFSSPNTRAIQVGFIQKTSTSEIFIPGRLNLGVPRIKDTFEATKESLLLPPVQTLLSRYKPEQISTITLLRETLSCQLNTALYDVGVHGHYGDAYIGATHIKQDGTIRSSYFYENTEGLISNGLWIVAESLCIGRNLAKTMESLFSKFSPFFPKEILLIAPLASRKAINTIGEIISKEHIPLTFVTWGGLFGVNEINLYDMPWGHPDTEPVDPRDRDLFISIYNDKLCIGGDFGNNYYSPSLSVNLYREQLKELHIIPKIPKVEDVMQIYKKGELLVRDP